jgi:hypothetical protein
MAVVGIFLYVGAEACMGRFLLPALSNVGASDDILKYFGPAAFFVWLTVGRLLGSAVLTMISSRNFFRISALLGLIGAGLLMSGSKTLSIVGVACAGLGFANIWPMLFSITVEEKPERASELSGLMCMAIAGGAIVPLIMGNIIDSKDMSRGLNQQITSESQGQIQLVNFTKVDRKDADAKTGAAATVGFTAQVRFKSDGTWMSKGSSDKALAWGLQPTQTTNGPAGGIAVKAGYSTVIKGEVVAKHDDKGWTYEVAGTQVLVEPAASVKLPEPPKVRVQDPDTMATATAFIIPVVCFAYLLLLSMKGGKSKTAPAKA